MAKRSVIIEKPKINERYYKDDTILIVASSFIYDVDTFISGFRFYRLVSSKTVKVSEFKTKLRIVQRKGKNRIIINLTLRGAPKQWLQEKRYTYLQ